MIKAVKKDTGSLVYMKLKKHTCPACKGAVLKRVKMKKTVKANTKEAAGFDLSAGGVALGEKVKFIWYELKCPECKASYTEDALHKAEEKAKKDAAQAKKEAKRAEAQAKKDAKAAEAKAEKDAKKAEAKAEKDAKKEKSAAEKEQKKAAARAEKDAKKAEKAKKKADSTEESTAE